MVTQTGLNYGHSLAENMDFTAECFDPLFYMFLATILCTFALGNLIFQEMSILRVTACVGAVALGLWGLFYCLSRLLKSLAWGLLVLGGLILGVVYFNSPVTLGLFYFLMVGGTFYTLWKIKKCEWLPALAAGLVGAVTILGAISTHSSFNLLARLAADEVNQDILFHSSIAAMIKNYGLASTGLHGLVEINYHLFSHWVVAGISLLSGVSVFEVYGAAPHLFFLPLLLFAIVSLPLLLNRDQGLNVFLLWVLALFFLTAVPELLPSAFILFKSYFGSESYAVSLGLMIIGLGPLYQRGFKTADIFLVVFLAMMITAAKGSTGLIYMGLWWIRALFFIQKETPKIIIGLILMTLGVGWTVAGSASTNAPGIEIGFFPYIEYVTAWRGDLYNLRTIYNTTGVVDVGHLAWSIIGIIQFAALHFFASWVVVFSCYKKGWRALWRSPSGLYSLGGIAAGMAIASLFSIPHGSAYYFTNVAFFISLPLILLLVYDGLMKLRIKNWGWNNKKLIASVAAIALVGWVSYGPLANLIQMPLVPAPGAQTFIKTLLEIKNTPDLDQYWSPSPELLAENPLKRVSARPFVYPALSERPWVNVVIAPKTTLREYYMYGYELYGLSARQQAITMEPVLKINGHRSLSLKQVEN